MVNEKIPIISIVGPTASGKTDLSINLALKLDTEIISADSMQIYKEFNILSAKPEKEKLSLVKHHLIDFLSVSEEFSVSKFINLSEKYINEIHSQGKIPILVGGTGLYVDSLLKGLKFENKKYCANNELIKFLDNLNGEEMLEILKKIDPMSSKKIHVNDVKRLKRAIEFFYEEGYPISYQVENSKNIVSPYNTCRIGLNFESRDILYDRINKRIDKMFENGIEKEVEMISKINLSKTSSMAIGYKEILPYILGKCTKEEACEELKKATRRYAKRQLTWFRKNSDINWIYVDKCKDMSEVIKKSFEIVNKFIFENKKDKYENI